MNPFEISNHEKQKEKHAAIQFFRSLLDILIDLESTSIVCSSKYPAGGVMRSIDDHFFITDIDSFRLVHNGKTISFENASRELLRPALASLYA